MSQKLERLTDDEICGQLQQIGGALLTARHCEFRQSIEALCSGGAVLPPRDFFRLEDEFKKETDRMVAALETAYKRIKEYAEQDEGS